MQQTRDQDAAPPERGFETRAIHSGQPPDPGTGAVNVPVYLTSTYAQSAPGVHQGYDYSRTANPTRGGGGRRRGGRGGRPPAAPAGRRVRGPAAQRARRN
ncbi:MAG: hypothetical protein F4X99_05355, partial [Gammaproteobacteria bacterium]|nr:hypothetical protein [Gammaproteobacteria bacterium]